MKRIVIFIAVLGALVLGGCTSQESPDVVVAKCWTSLASGDVQGALSLVNMDAGQEAVYVEMFAERAAKLSEIGGVERVDIDSYYADDKDAKVEATVVLADGRTITATYTLTKVGRHWKINN